MEGVQQRFVGFRLCLLKRNVWCVFQYLSLIGLTFKVFAHSARGYIWAYRQHVGSQSIFKYMIGLYMFTFVVIK